MNYEKVGLEKIVGKTKEQAYKITKTKGNVTVKDVVNIKKQWIQEGLKKHKAVNIDMIKVLSGKWVTFTSEEKFTEYFENKVKDPTKFYNFEQVVFYVQTQN